MLQNRQPLRSRRFGVEGHQDVEQEEAKGGSVYGRPLKSEEEEEGSFQRLRP